MSSRGRSKGEGSSPEIDCRSDRKHETKSRTNLGGDPRQVLLDSGGHLPRNQLSRDQSVAVSVGWLKRVVPPPYSRLLNRCLNSLMLESLVNCSSHRVETDPDGSNRPPYTTPPNKLHRSIRATARIDCFPSTIFDTWNHRVGRDSNRRIDALCAHSMGTLTLRRCK